AEDRAPARLGRQTPEIKTPFGESGKRPTIVGKATKPVISQGHLQALSAPVVDFKRVVFVPSGLVEIRNDAPEVEPATVKLVYEHGGAVCRRLDRKRGLGSIRPARLAQHGN